MKLFNCLRCAHHVDHTDSSIICNYYYDQMLERPLINSEDMAHAFIMNCPLGKKVSVH